MSDHSQSPLADLLLPSPREMWEEIRRLRSENIVLTERIARLEGHTYRSIGELARSQMATSASVMRFAGTVLQAVSGSGRLISARALPPVVPPLADRTGPIC